MGGNLSMICHLLGTPWALDLKDAILFLEDTGEAPYRLDRLITQLELAGVPDLVQGVALGYLGKGGRVDPEQNRAVEERLGAWGLPVVKGLPFGHGRVNRILPVGALAELDGGGRLTVGVDFA